MFKFFKKHPPKEGEEREKLKKELFGFRKCIDHGFPSKPSAMAYDPKLRLLAIGTKSGVLKVLGRPGVEFTAQHDQDVTVVQLFFLQEQGRLISFCSDNSLHLWETNVRGGKTVLEKVKSYTVETSKNKAVSTCCLSINGEQLYLGTEGGNIQILDVNTFTLSEQVIQQDVVMQNVPDDFKVNPGAVEAIAVHPTNPDKLLIGYNRGLIVLWDNKDFNANQTYNVSRQLESLNWHRNGKEFSSAHSDGSYSVWNVEDSTKPDNEQTPYGPFPCKAITKLERRTAKADPFLIFSGGMPRASYGDRHTITVMQGESHTVFDFTSRVIDFITLNRSDETDCVEDRADKDEPHSLIVLAEEELVVIDLDSVNWPTFKLPYLHSIHSSAITCSQHINNVPDQLWYKIQDAGESQLKNLSQRTWPINGGRNDVKDSNNRDLLLTGHEDGTVRFWNASASNLTLLYKLSTASYFGGDVGGDQNSAEEEEEWPPFKKVGTFDPYSDDPRLSIQKVNLCPLSETLVLAGTAGQVITFQMEREEREQEVKSTTVNIVSDRDSFVWKGHEALVPKEGDVKFAAGFQPIAMMQLYPPAAVTALSLHSEWQIIGAGTAHGFGLYDYLQKREVTSRCTLNPTDLTGTSETAMSRRKSLKKSLRESFRRLRKGRSERRPRDNKAKTETGGIEQTETPVEGAAAIAGTPEPKPVERQIEARSIEDSMSSMVRCIYFADTFIVNGAPNNPSMWIGTNGGHVYIYNLTLPSSDKRPDAAVTCQLAKEIKLKHRAPVISMVVIDSRARILPDPLEVQHEKAKAPDMSGSHSVIICSEEQLKTFTLPTLKPKWKSKITAHDGSRIRRIGFVNFRSKSADNYSEFDIACLSNLGEISVYSVTSLRQQMHVPAVKKEDINGIASFIFTKDGQAFYLKSSSEFDRITLSPRHITLALGMLELKDGMRPDPEPETEHIDDTADITIGLADDSQHNDSRGDTTGDITVDSIRDVAAEGEDTITNMVQNAANTASSDASNVIQSVTTYSSTVMSTMESSVTSSVREVTTSVSRHISSDVTETTGGSDNHSSGGGGDDDSGTGGGGGDLKNIDDDIKATVTKIIETTEVKKLSDLKLTEETKIMDNGKTTKEILTEN